MITADLHKSKIPEFEYPIQVTVRIDINLNYKNYFTFEGHFKQPEKNPIVNTKTDSFSQQYQILDRFI